MHRLVPYFVLEKWQHQQREGSMLAFTMFVDLSGFTRLTDELMRQGNVGAENLSITLNDIFEPLVHLVYARGGFIPYFAGDSFTGVFPMADTDGDITHLLETAVAARELFRQRENRFGEFTIGIKIGLGAGEILWGVVGDQRLAFYFRGPAIRQAADAQMAATEGEIICPAGFQSSLSTDQWQLSAHSDPAWCLLTTYPRQHIPLKTHPQMVTVPTELIQRFLPTGLTDRFTGGEFRRVLSIFISFDGVQSHELLNQFATIIMEQIHRFAGYFKEVDFGDKGGVLVGFIGAPTSFENNVERALEFALSLRGLLRPLVNNNDLRYRIGMTMGTAFTGMIGGQERCQYAVVGNYVNLAARLMMKADWGETLVGEEIQSRPQFKFRHKGNLRYKGFTDSISTYKLLGRDQRHTQTFNDVLVGREQHMTAIKDFVTPLFNVGMSGVAYVFGEAGMGKSRLTYELRQQFFQERQSNWFVCPTDQILRKPFNPFIYFLNSYFSQEQEQSAAYNQERFEEQLRQLHSRLAESPHPEAANISHELSRTASVLQALIGLPLAQDALWHQLDAWGRHENTMTAVVQLILAESLMQPLVLEIEDAHWLENNSRELLRELVRHMANFPILLLITSRYQDDGAKPWAIPPDWLSANEIPVMEINLQPLEAGEIKAYARDKLGGRVSNEMVDLLLRTSNGNPFYVEQLLEYIKEQDLLVKDGHTFSIAESEGMISEGINAILTARIDRLSAQVRETVKAAAVIGREFEVPILNEVMRQQDIFTEDSPADSPALLLEQIQTAERVQIWLSISELRYIFRHSLLREAVYNMQMRSRLQELHRLIAEAIERLYPDQLENRYVDLAFHYEQADAYDKTIEYLRKAADHARRNYQNQQALDYYERLLRKLNAKTDAQSQVGTLLKKGRVLELIGEWTECQKVYEQALEYAKESRDALMLGRANNSLGELLLLKGDYIKAGAYLRTAAGLFELIDNPAGTAKIYGDLGHLNFRIGKYDEAKDYFERSLKLSASQPVRRIDPQIVYNLGLTHMNQGNYAQGIAVISEHLEQANLRQDKQAQVALYTGLGLVYHEQGNLKAGLMNYRKGLELADELGNKRFIAIALGSIGSIMQRKGDYQTALRHFERDLSICEDLGDKQGTAIALGLLGELFTIQGQFYKAIDYLQKNLMLCEELGYQKGIAKSANVLGDVFRLMKDHNRAIHYYDRAIQVTRQIDNKLVLGESLAEKAFVLIDAGRPKESLDLVKESLNIAQQLGNPDLLFETRLLNIQMDLIQGQEADARSALEAMLEEFTAADQQALLHYRLSTLPGADPQHERQAIELYKSLYSGTPKYIYRLRLEELDIPLPEVVLKGEEE